MEKYVLTKQNAIILFIKTTDITRKQEKSCDLLTASKVFRMLKLSLQNLFLFK